VPAKNTLIFIGGLGDGLCTVSYVPLLAKALPPTWKLVQVVLSSSYMGWGFSSLDRDAAELSECVKYFRGLEKDTNSGKIILMGHSTGCQDCMEYVVGPKGLTRSHGSRSWVDGIILQAPVSDREAMEVAMEDADYKLAAKEAERLISIGQGDAIMPRELTKEFFNTICTAERWYSLASPPPAHDGLDDYFSSDLTDQQLSKTFGDWRKGPRICILYGEADEVVPPRVDKTRLVNRWTQFLSNIQADVDLKNGGVVPGATHTLENCDLVVVTDVLKRVVAFLEFS